MPTAEEKLKQELAERIPHAANISAVTGDYTKRFGSADDALLYLEWFDGMKLSSSFEAQQELINSILSRAKGPHLAQIIRGRMRDGLIPIGRA